MPPPPLPSTALPLIAQFVMLGLLLEQQMPPPEPAELPVIMQPVIAGVPPEQ